MPEVLMVIVDPRFGRIVAEVMHHVPDIMQQRCGNQCRAFPLRFRQQRRLQRVLPLVDRAQPVLPMPLAIDDRGKFIEARIADVHFIQLSFVMAHNIVRPRARQSAPPLPGMTFP